MARGDTARKTNPADLGIPDPGAAPVEAPQTPLDAKLGRMSKAAEAAKSPEGILSALKEGDRRQKEGARAREEREKQSTQKLTAELHDIAELLEIFEVCENLNPSLSPDVLNKAVMDVRRANLAQVKEKEQPAISKVEEKYGIPQGLLGRYMDQIKKIGTKDLTKIFQKFGEGLAKLSEKGPVSPTLEATAEKIAKWSKVVTTERSSRDTKNAETRNQEIQNLIDSVWSGKLTPDAILDLTTPEKKMLLDHATKLAKTEGEVGAIFYQKLDALGLTKKAKEPVSAQMADSRNRFNPNEARMASGLASTNIKIPEGQRNAAEFFKNSPDLQSEFAAADAAALKAREAGTTEEETTSQPETTAKKEQAPTTEKAPEAPAGGLKNFFKGMWNRLTKPGTSEEGKTREKLMKGADKKIDKAFREKYQARVRELKKMGTNFAEASRLAGLSEKETELIIDILQGKELLLTSEQKKSVAQSREKVMQFALEKPSNQARQQLADLYIDAAKEVNIDQISPVAAERLWQRQKNRMPSSGNPSERGGTGTPTV